MMFKNSYLWLLIAAVLLVSVQVLGGIIYIYSFFPLVWDDSFLKGVEPNRDVLFYAIFLVMTTGLTALGVKLLLPKFNSPDVRSKFKFWLGLEVFWCFLIWFCFFKWTTYRYPFWNILMYENQGWLRPFFWAVCAGALLSKIFFSEIEHFYRRLQVLAAKESFLKHYIFLLQAVFIGAVGILLYIPKPQEVAALSFSWDQLNHLDHAAGWFIKHGWYVSYEQTIQILVMGAIAYVIGLFYFVRLWLGSWLLAAIGALLVIKVGMFYYGISPCTWVYPANTFLAHGWDIILFFWLWWVSVKYPKKFYVAAALTGLLLVWAWIKSNGHIGAAGLDNQPMMAPLRAREFFPFFMGFFVPVFYVFTLLVVQERLGAALCIYGLMIFINYLEYPLTGFYGAWIGPAVLVVLWWLKQILRSLTLLAQRAAYAGIFFLVLGALLTNRLMLTYPNVFFQDPKRFEREKGFYQNFSALSAPAGLIHQLVKEDQKVVLLSNFETALLMQAKRQPLFKDFPIMFSNFSSSPGGLNLKTKEQGLDLINSIAAENALYVFVDARMLASPAQGGLAAVLGYLKNHYQILTHQGFLVGLQRK
jgi:hypothetical protein